MVAARELSLEELSRMHQASPIEIEAFCTRGIMHSYSGQCLMSSILGGRSGNRGRCATALPPALSGDAVREKKRKNFCPLSLKDICTIEILPEILKAGATSLKIEGRMETAILYSRCDSHVPEISDLLLSRGRRTTRYLKKTKKYLLDLFNRGGSCTGYYQIGNGPQMMAFTNEKKNQRPFP